jgi:hypothetical protein
MKTVSIGTMRDDGDFAILATLNNNDGHMSDEDFAELTQALTLTIANYTDAQIQVLERQDAPDYVEVSA